MVSEKLAYQMVFFGACVSFLEEYGYVLKDEIRLQQNAKMRDFLKAAKNLTYKFEKDLPPSAVELNETIKEVLFDTEDEFIKELLEVKEKS